MRLRAALRLTAAITISLGYYLLNPASGKAAAPVAVQQGAAWTTEAQRQFYSQDQGSQVIPLSWFQALKQPNGEPFLGTNLRRYGYLPNPLSPVSGLPVGFTTNGVGGSTMLGMTCAACHTREIDVGGAAYRIDGGPAIVDFQSFLQDLDIAVGNVLQNNATFTQFAVAVLGPSPSHAAALELRNAVALWFLRYDTLMDAALPAQPWGPARLDAVSLIFDRLTGLDLGPPPSYLIPSNIRLADAPVRYPFLWNAAIQDHTQWPGFAENGNALLSLGRNLGEVFGVFATFAPKQTFLGTDFLADNSANFNGLFALGTLMKKIGPPRWPWAINASLASQGEAIFNRSTADGGCVSCHGIKPGVTRFLDQKTWATPILNVSTDTREYGVLGWMAQSGVLNGTYTLIDPTPLKPVDYSISILDMSVLGAIEQYCLTNPFSCAINLSLPGLRSGDVSRAQVMREVAESVTTLYKVNATPDAYEARVLQGIWAAAPYLHNGSVPTLAQLLTPSSQRVMSFAVGPNYDIEDVGLAKYQTKFNYTYQATGCDDLNSGNSNCGHDYGTALSASDKAALLEYLKTL